MTDGMRPKEDGDKIIRPDQEIPSTSKETRPRTGIHKTIQKNSVGFIPWDEITVGKDQIP